MLTLALIGCAVYGPATNHATQAANIATRFNNDFNKGGMTEVIIDIQHCYQENAGAIVLVNELRDRTILDYTGYKMDIALGQHLLKGPPLPFFENAFFAARLDHYTHLAQFQTTQELAQYLEEAYAIVTQDIVQIHQQEGVFNRLSITNQPRD